MYAYSSSLDVIIFEFKVHTPMPLTPWVESTSTLRALAPTIHVLLDTQNMFAPPTEYGFLISFVKRPDSRLVVFKLIVAADACVELVATEVLDGDDVEGRVPVGALC